MIGIWPLPPPNLRKTNINEQSSHDLQSTRNTEQRPEHQGHRDLTASSVQQLAFSRIYSISLPLSPPTLPATIITMSSPAATDEFAAQVQTIVDNAIKAIRDAADEATFALNKATADLLAAIDAANSPQAQTDTHDEVFEPTADQGCWFCNKVPKGTMVLCDGEQCDYRFFHAKCLGMSKKALKRHAACDEDWFCPECKGEVKKGGLRK